MSDKAKSDFTDRIHVSVVIPTFNRLAKLEKSINSILNQSFRNFELIVVNDSEDEESVIELINGFKDKRIKYFKNLAYGKSLNYKSY